MACDTALQSSQIAGLLTRAAPGTQCAFNHLSKLCSLTFAPELVTGSNTKRDY
jgi:hypothetical protein